jgi:hypothetical protein
MESDEASMMFTIFIALDHYSFETSPPSLAFAIKVLSEDTTIETMRTELWLVVKLLI